MARVEPAPSGGLEPDSLHVVHCRAAGLDVHRMRITAAVRPAQPPWNPPTATEEFGTMPNGLRNLTPWLLSHGVSGAAIEVPGCSGRRPSRRSRMQASKRSSILRFVEQSKGGKSDVAGRLRLARICQFGLCQPGHVPPREFRQLRQFCRFRR